MMTNSYSTIVAEQIAILLIEEGMPPALNAIAAELTASDGIHVDVVANTHLGRHFGRQNPVHILIAHQTAYDSAEWLRQPNQARPVILIGEWQPLAGIHTYLRNGVSDYLVVGPQLCTNMLRFAIYKAHAQHLHLQQRVDTLSQRVEHLRQLNQSSQLLASTLDSQQVMTQMLMEVTAITGAKDASVWEWADENREHLVCHATSNLGLLDTLQRHRVARGSGIAGWVVESGESTIVGNTEHDERFLASIDEWTGFHTESVLAVPLRVRDDILGVLEILNKDEPFDEEDISLAETLAASAAIALDNARLIETMQQQQLELHARNTELDAFAHTVAHDLKTPLNWVQGYSELLIKDWPLLGDDERIEYAKAARTGAHKMETIIDDLLLLASLRQEDIAVESVDMQDVLRQAWMRLQPMIEQHDAELHSPFDYPQVLGYGPWIEGVWVNLISNAIKYGGRPPRVKLGFNDTQDGFVTFWVMDNGNGLTPEQQAKLFVPFSRLERRRANGHGLGLSIVQRIVDKLGGTVSVDSKLGQGSCFSFRLPKHR